MLKQLICVAIVCLVFPCYAANITPRIIGPFCRIEINGPIEATDLGRLKIAKGNVLKQGKAANPKQEARCRGLYVGLNSPGGDVMEALALGKYLRSVEASTEVGSYSHCESACIFVLVGGVKRFASSGARISIHRPYFNNLSNDLSTTEIRRMREKYLNQIKNYLIEMDISPALLDKMLSIPPEDMETLSKEQLRQYRVIGIDATFDEKQTAEQATRYELTSAEYRKRKNIIEHTCPSWFDKSGNFSVKTDTKRILCEESILWGISKDEVKQRDLEVRGICSKYRENIDRFSQCRKTIMKGRSWEVQE